MPPPIALKPGQKIYCLLEDAGRRHYRFAYRGHTEEERAAVLQVGTEWLSSPDGEHGDELLLVEINVLKRLRRVERKAEVEIDDV